jgi:hypothetical protein
MVQLFSKEHTTPPFHATITLLHFTITLISEQNTSHASVPMGLGCSTTAPWRRKAEK